MQIIRIFKGRARDKLIEKLQESKEKEREREREREKSRTRPHRSYSLGFRGRRGSYSSLERGYSPDPNYMAPAREDRGREVRPLSPSRSNGKLVKAQLISKDNQGDHSDIVNRHCQAPVTTHRGRRRGKSTKRSPARSSNDEFDQLSSPPLPPIQPKWTQDVRNNASIDNKPQPARNNDAVARPNNRDPHPIVDRNGETFANRMRKQQAEQTANNRERAAQADILRQIQESTRRKEAQIKADAGAAARLQQEECEKEASETLRANAAADTRAQNQERERRANTAAERAFKNEREKREKEEEERKEAAAKKNQESRLKAFGPSSDPAPQPRAEPARRNTAPARPGPDPRARPKLTAPVPPPVPRPMPAPVPAPLTAANLKAQKDDHYLQHMKSELNRGMGDSARTIIPGMMIEEEYAEWEAKLKRENAERARRGLHPLE